jgi:hypothetical protein
VFAHDNQVLDTVNYGIAISAGHDARFERNRIFSIGQLPDGRPMKAQNVGAYVWDSHNAGKPHFYNNSGSENLIAWATPDGGRNDWWHPDASAWDHNSSWRGNFTRDVYADESRRWRAKLETKRIAVGPRPTTQPSAR